MSTFKMTDENDLAIENNTLVLLTDGEEVNQRIIERLKTFYGEWFLDLRVGVPWIQSILVQNPNADIIASIIKREIMGTPGVETMIAYDQELDLDTRKLTVTFEVTAGSEKLAIDLTL